jgi:paired amphipathic helix protein Sin3a
MEATVRLFKKDDPTFEFGALDRVKRWRHYVASFMTVEPTEEVDLARVQVPYLRGRLSKADEGEDERLDYAKEMDRVTISINPSAYMIKFIASGPDTDEGTQFFVQKDTTRCGIKEDVENPIEGFKNLRETRRDLVQDKLIRNNAWMKNMSRDDVDARKSSFKKDLEEPKQVNGASNDDVEMGEL